MAGNFNLTTFYLLFWELKEEVGDFSMIKQANVKGVTKKLCIINDKLKNYLVKTQVIVDDRSDSRYNDQLVNIVIVLLVNTGFGDDNQLPNIPEYTNFIGTIPSLSRLILMNVIVALDLMKQCVSFVLTIPPDIAEELFRYFIRLSKSCQTWKAFFDAYTVANTIIIMINNLHRVESTENTNTINKLRGTVSKILENMSIINDWSRKTLIQKHTQKGYAVFFLFRLIRTCALDKICLKKVVNTLKDSTTSVLRSLSVDVYRSWAEVIMPGSNLLMLNVIAAEALALLDHIPDNKELLSVVSPVLTRSGSDNTFDDRLDVMAKIGTTAENQQFSFCSIINTNFFKTELAMICLDEWVDLCTKDDVVELLIFYLDSTESEVKHLTLKCARVLSVQDFEIQNVTKTEFLEAFESGPSTRNCNVGDTDSLDTVGNQLFDTFRILNENFIPQLEVLLNTNDFNRLLRTVRLLKKASIDFVLHKNTVNLISLLTRILEKTRCNMDNFIIIQQIIVKEVLNILSKYSPSADIQLHNMQFQEVIDQLIVTNSLNRYQLTKLYQNLEGKFLEYAWPVDKCVKCTFRDFYSLSHVLSSCIDSEWLLVVQELDAMYNSYSYLLLAFECILIHLCRAIAEKDDGTDELRLKYYLQQHIIAIERILKPKYTTLDEEIILIESLCKIVNELPENTSKVEGLQLINLFSENALRYLLANDKFIHFINYDLKDRKIAQVLASKMGLEL